MSRAVLAEQLRAHAQVAVLEHAEGRDRRLRRSPPSARVNARSAITQSIGDLVVDGASARFASGCRWCGTPCRSPPGPAPGSMISVGIAVPASISSRFRPAAASRVASTSPLFDLLQPRFDIAAERHDLEVGPQPQQLRRAPRRRGADHARLASACRSTRRRSAGRARRRAGAPRRCGSRSGRIAFDILHRMDAEIDFAVEQRAVELLGPQRLAADLGQRPVLDLVAGGLDRDDLRPSRRASAARSRSPPRPCAPAPAPAAIRESRGEVPACPTPSASAAASGKGPAAK